MGFKKKKKGKSLRKKSQKLFPREATAAVPTWVFPRVLNLILGRSTKEKKRPNLSCKERKTRHMVILHTMVTASFPVQTPVHASRSDTA